jgi:hypothetical protein
MHVAPTRYLIPLLSGQNVNMVTGVLSLKPHYPPPYVLPVLIMNCEAALAASVDSDAGGKTLFVVPAHMLLLVLVAHMLLLLLVDHMLLLVLVAHMLLLLLVAHMLLLLLVAHMLLLLLVVHMLLLLLFSASKRLLLVFMCVQLAILDS